MIDGHARYIFGEGGRFQFPYLLFRKRSSEGLITVKSLCSEGGVSAYF
jgi:hypothetical protein